MRQGYIFNRQSDQFMQKVKGLNDKIRVKLKVAVNYEFYCLIVKKYRF